MGAGGYKDAWRGQMKCPQMSDDTVSGAGTLGTLSAPSPLPWTTQQPRLKAEK